MKYTWKPLVCLYLENQKLVFLGNLILFKAWYEDVANWLSGFWKARNKSGNSSEVASGDLGFVVITALLSCLSLRLGFHFNKSLINIFQLVWLLYDDPERSYDRLKLTSIFIKLGVTQVLTYPCWDRSITIIFQNARVSRVMPSLNLKKSATINKWAHF